MCDTAVVPLATDFAPRFEGSGRQTERARTNGDSLLPALPLTPSVSLIPPEFILLDVQ